jgi:uncharacterized protein (TIGR02117 family)
MVNRIGRTLRKLARFGLFVLILLLLPILLYLMASVIGGFVPRNLPPKAMAGESIKADPGIAGNSDETITIYLVTGLLHADIAIPADDRLLGRFSFLYETKLPFANPGLKYLAFGWGSLAFYTTAGSYSDIRPGAVFTAVTGDDAVMRVTPIGALVEDNDVVALTLSQRQYDQLLERILTGFASDEDGLPRYLPQYSIGQGDAFYAGTGHFNIFHPCNQWVAEVLAAASIRTGIWTPTTYSLLLSLDRKTSKAQ